MVGAKRSGFFPMGFLMNETFELTIVDGVAVATVRLRTEEGHTHLYRFEIKRWMDACMQVTLAAVRGQLSWSDAAWLSLAIHRQLKNYNHVIDGMKR